MKVRVWFGTLAVLFLSSATAESQLVITEVVEGTSFNLKYVEIQNRGATSINLATAGVQIRRYTNGSTTASIPYLDLTTGSIPAGGFFVIANNAADFNNVWALPAAANLYSTYINHSGNDSYELWMGGAVVDAFAKDNASGTDPGNFAANGAFHRVASAYLPSGNNGNWGGTTPAVDGGLSPSGYWIMDAMTASNGNAATICTPGTWGGSSGTELPVEIQSFEIK